MEEGCRKAFQEIAEANYEGNFAQYADGSYVDEGQQAQWEGFHDGWYAVMKRLAGPINLLIGFARSGNEVETDDAPFNAWLSGLDEYAEKAAAAWDALMLPEPPTARGHRVQCPGNFRISREGHKGIAGSGGFHLCAFTQA